MWMPLWNCTTQKFIDQRVPQTLLKQIAQITKPAIFAVAVADEHTPATGGTALMISELPSLLFPSRPLAQKPESILKMIPRLP